MTDQSKNTDSNPISLANGPDQHIRTFLHGLFERNRSNAAFSLEDWGAWEGEDVAGAIRALANDYLATHGAGFDWVTAGHEAEFVLAAVFHEVAHSAGIVPAPRLYLNFFDPFMGEGFELEAVPPSDIVMDPLPGAPVASTSDSQRVRALLMVPPGGDATKAASPALVAGARQLSEFFEVTNRLPLMFMGAALTMWRGLQASHHVRAASIYREIRNTDRPEIPVGSMRLLYARTGDKVMAAAQANPQDINLFIE